VCLLLELAVKFPVPLFSSISPFIPPPQLQTMSVMELWMGDIMLSISVTHVYHNCLRSTSPMIYSCSYVAHALSSFSSLTTVFLAALLSIINLPNLTMNNFTDASCGWIYDCGKLTVQFSPTH